MTDKPEDETQDAKGTIMTEIDCPCGEVFCLEGDRNGETIECPECGSILMVRTT